MRGCCEFYSESKTGNVVKADRSTMSCKSSFSQKLILVFTLFFLMLSFLSTASAHRINLFCRTKQEKIICSSSYADGAAVKNAEIKVFSQKDKEILISGKTDQDGKFSFHISKALEQNTPDLKITVAESMGHKDSWIVKSEEYRHDQNSKQKNETKTWDEAGKNKYPDVEQKDKSSMDRINREKLKELIKETIAREQRPIDSKIETLIKTLRQYKQKTSFRDIFGGIGYIIGIMGILFFVKGRNKRS